MVGKGIVALIVRTSGMLGGTALSSRKRWSIRFRRTRHTRSPEWKASHVTGGELTHCRNWKTGCVAITCEEERQPLRRRVSMHVGSQGASEWVSEWLKRGDVVITCGGCDQLITPPTAPVVTTSVPAREWTAHEAW